MKKILFTDLDGTLLDLNTYSVEVARQAVKKLQNAGVSIVFCSSKTWAEQEAYLHELSISEPAIVENGSGIFLSSRHEVSASFYQEPTVEVYGKNAIVLGKKYSEIVELLNKYAANCGYKYYGNSTIKEIARITKLSAEAAERARTRDFSETIFNADLESSTFKQLERSLSEYGIQCIPGSKYLTLSGDESDKGRAVQIISEAFRKRFGEIATFGAGDSRNDKEMLDVVDNAFLVQKPDLSWANIEIDTLTQINGVGPHGWNKVADIVLKA